MIGRVVHYRDRRILIFCGERSHDQHPVYGIVDNGAAVGEEAEARTYQSNKFHETESTVALGADNEAYTTSAAKLPDIENGLSLRQSVEATAYVNVYASVGGGILIDSSADTMKTISVFSEVGSGIATSGDIETIKTSVAKLAESDEVIAVGGNSKGFMTSHHNEAEAESGISTPQNVEASVSEPTITIMAGKYDPRDDITNYEALQLNISFSYIDDVEQLVYANSIETKYEYIFQAWGWTISFDNSRVGLEMGSYFWGCPSITVLQNTEVPLSQYYIFFRYFRFVSY